MRRALRPLLLLFAALAAAAPARAQPGCGASPDLLRATAPLPVTARAVAAGALRLVVVGGASIFGPGTTGPGAAWPARLEAALATRYPGLRLTTTVRGGRGLTAAELAAMVAEEAARRPAPLIIWQTGTVEAARGMEVDELSNAVSAGLERARAAGADAVLMDQQFSRFLRANADIEPYRDALRLAAAAHDAVLFRRYDIMRAWAESDHIDLERTPRAQREVATDRLNDCIGKTLAAVIAHGVEEAPPPPAPHRP